MDPAPQLTVIVPAFNEEGTVALPHRLVCDCPSPLSTKGACLSYPILVLVGVTSPQGSRSASFTD
jgi:hypothetical protein